MKVSRLIEILRERLAENSDIEVVVAYDSSHGEIEEGSLYGDDGFGPRQVLAVHRGYTNRLFDPAEIDLGEKVIQI